MIGINSSVSGRTRRLFILIELLLLNLLAMRWLCNGMQSSLLLFLVCIEGALALSDDSSYAQPVYVTYFGSLALAGCLLDIHFGVQNILCSDLVHYRLHEGLTKHVLLSYTRSVLYLASSAVQLSGSIVSYIIYNDLQEQDMEALIPQEERSERAFRLYHSILYQGQRAVRQQQQQRQPRQQSASGTREAVRGVSEPLMFKGAFSGAAHKIPE